MINYVFDKETGIVFAKPDADIQPDHVISFYNRVKEDITLPKKIKILINTKLYNNKVSPRDLQQLKGAILSVHEAYENVRIAVVHSHPLGMALSSLLVKMIKVEFRAFSEEENAIGWLNMT